MGNRLHIQVREEDDGLVFDFSFPDQAARGAFAEYFPPEQPLAEREAERVRATLLGGFHGSPGWLEELRTWGRNAFVRYLPEELQATLESLEESHITLKLGSQRAAAFPWELLHDGKDFLTRRHVLGRLLKSQARPRAKPRSDGRMLILANLSKDLPAAEAEGIGLAHFLETDPKFKSLGTGRLASPKLITQVSRNTIRKELEEAQVVHFCSHTRNLPEKGGVGWVLSRGEILNLEDIRDLGKGDASPALVFSNSCTPPGPGASESGQAGTGAMEGIAEAFLAAGVGGYIGTLCEVEDTSSLVFAQEFFRAITLDKSLPAALQEARRKIVPSSPIWAAYRYYGDPHFRLPMSGQDMDGIPPEIAESVGRPAPKETAATALTKRALRPFGKAMWITAGLLLLAALAGSIATLRWNREKQNFHYQEGQDRPMPGWEK